MGLLLGIDIGTSSTKAVVIDEKGNNVSLGHCAYDIQMPIPGYAEQEAEMLWSSVCDAVCQALSNQQIRTDISAIGLSGQMHGLVLLDTAFQPIRPIIIWADQRSQKQVEELKQNGLETHVGNPIASGFLYPSLLWVREHEPVQYSRIRYVMLPKDYIRYRICGTIGTDYSDASGTLIFDLWSKDWYYEELKRAGVPAEIFPPIFNSTSLAGTVTESFCQCTGLPKGIPVVFGGGDSLMQMAANGVVEKGSICTNIGTASQITCVCDYPGNPKYQLNIFAHVQNSLWAASKASLNGGIVLKWIRNNLYLNQIDYRMMDQIAAQSVPGANGVVFMPFLCGERYAPQGEHPTGVLYGLKISNDKHDIIRAIMESVVFAFREGLETFEQCRFPMDDLLVASGGGTNSAVWLQMQADILQKVIRVSAEKEEAARGAAIAAGVGTGVFESFREASNAVSSHDAAVFEPNLQSTAIYQEKYQLYRSLCHLSRDAFRLL